MTFEAYTNPDFTWPQKILFFLICAGAVFLCLLLIQAVSKASVQSVRKKKRAVLLYERTMTWTQKFYEMIIAGTSVISFASSYVVLNHIYALIEEGAAAGAAAEGFATAWANGKDFILLLLICLSCILNTVLDKLLIPLKQLDRSQIATIRMLSMFYVIIILVFLNLIGDESEYSPVMIYYLGLMVGRFVYFDASFMDFVSAMKNVILNLPFLLLGLALSGGLSFLGFKLGYLLERNYYIVGLFYTHIFLLIAVFIFHHCRIVRLFVKKPKRMEIAEPAQPLEAPFPEDPTKEAPLPENHFPEEEPPEE